MNERQTHPHELISAMLDGEIDERERADVEAHLRECPECRDLAGDFAALGVVLADEPVPPVPAGLASRIGWSLRSREAARRRGASMRWSGPRMLTALGGVAAAAVLAVLVVREGNAPFREGSSLSTPPRPESDAMRQEAKPTAALGKDESPSATAPGAAGGTTRPGDKALREGTPEKEKLRALGYVQGSDEERGPRAQQRPSPGLLDGSTRQRSAGGAPAAKPDFAEHGYAPAPPREAPGKPAAVMPEEQVAAPSPAPPPPPPPTASAADAEARRKRPLAANEVAPAEEKVEERFLGAERDKKEPRGDFDQDLPAAKDAASATGSMVGGAAPGAPGGEGAASGPAPTARAAESPSPGLVPANSKIIEDESSGKRAIEACPGSEGAKPPRRWSATSAPLPLRAVRSDAEPDLAGLAARLGGSVCADTTGGAAPLLVIDVPVARWIELRDALTARAASEPSLSAPPAQGYDVVRVVVRPR